MVENLFIPPAPILASYVRHYKMRVFSTGGLDMLIPWYAIPEISLMFFLKDRPVYCKDEKSGYYVEGDHDIAILGLSDRFNGIMVLKGEYVMFHIDFMPNGFHCIFNVPTLDELTNRVYALDGFLGSSGQSLLDQLRNARDIYEMAGFADLFLEGFLKKRQIRYTYHGLERVAGLMLDHAGQVNIRQYADDSSMSIRNFERRFVEQVGTSPKLFCRMLRFNKALRYKIQHPHKSWAEISFRFGYHDQMHLIRDFKDFTDTTPVTFFAQTPPPLEKSVFLKRP